MIFIRRLHGLICFSFFLRSLMCHMRPQKSVDVLPRPTSPSRPVLRRESAQDYGDAADAADIPESCRLRLPIPTTPQPPDLKIELLTDPNPPSTLFPYPDNPDLSARRHSHCQRAPPISRNKSAPATPLSRSITNMQHQIMRTSSKDGYLMVKQFHFNQFFY